MIQEPEEVDVRLIEYVDSIEEGGEFGAKELSHLKRLYAEAGRRWQGLKDERIANLIVLASEIIGSTYGYALFLEGEGYTALSVAHAAKVHGLPVISPYPHVPYTLTELYLYECAGKGMTHAEVLEELGALDLLDSPYLALERLQQVAYRDREEYSRGKTCSTLDQLTGLLTSQALVLGDYDFSSSRVVARIAEQIIFRMPADKEGSYRAWSYRGASLWDLAGATE